MNPTHIFYILLSCSIFASCTSNPTISTNDVEKKLLALEPNVGSYPPRFKSETQRSHITSELKEIITFLDTKVKDNPTDEKSLFQHAWANSMGHNVDFPGCANKADKSFTRFLKLNPDDKRGNFYYGVLLASTGLNFDLAIQYLKKAVDLGLSDAHYPLAMTYLVKENRQLAIQHLNQYAKANPNDEMVKQKIKQLEDSKNTIRTINIPLSSEKR